MPKPKHHYVPQFYLTGFETQGQLTVLNKETNKIFRSSTQKICAESDFFTITGLELINKEKLINIDIKDLNPNLLEDQLSKYESKVSPILRKIIKQCSFSEIDINDICFLLNWITWIYSANPHTKQIFQQKYPALSNAYIGKFMSSYEKNLPFFLARTWGIMKMDQPLFTGDYPVCIINKKDRTLVASSDLANSPIFFPISTTLLLIGKPNSNRKFNVVMETKLADKNFVKFANKVMFTNSNQIIAKDKNHIERFRTAGAGIESIPAPN